MVNLDINPLFCRLVFYYNLFLDKEIPRITNCPSSFTMFLEPGETSQIVTWQEPIFTDNIEVVSVVKSKVSNQMKIF